MSNYETTITFTLSLTQGDFVDDFELEVIKRGYCGHDGGQSDVEAPTEFFVDGADVNPYDDEEMKPEIRAALFDMEVNHYTNKNYKTREA